MKNKVSHSMKLERMGLSVHADHFYTSAMATAECVEVQPDWWVLDMCAAPGGKSSQLRNKLGENGVLISNEIIPSRCRILTGNVERLGFRNTATTCPLASS